MRQLIIGGKDLVAVDARPILPASSPTGNSHFNIAEWVAAGYDEAFITSYLNSEGNSYNHPNAAIEPRIPGIFQYYSIAEDELAKIFGRQSYGAGRRRRNCCCLGENH